MTCSAISGSVRKNFESYAPYLVSKEAMYVASGIAICQVFQKSALGFCLTAGYLAGAHYWRSKTASPQERFSVPSSENSSPSPSPELSQRKLAPSRFNPLAARSASPLELERAPSPLVDSPRGSSSPLVSQSAQLISRELQIRTFSHEARNALGAVQASVGFAVAAVQDFLTGKPLNTNQLVADLTTAQISTDQVLDLCTTYLDNAKLGKPATNPVLLENLVRAVNVQIEPKAKAKGIKSSFALDSRIPPYILGDQGKLIQVLANFGGNAVKFTPEGGKVAITATLENIQGKTFILFEVTDTGRGIAKEDMGKLFQEFSQVGDRLEGANKGTGLGLTICRDIIHAINDYTSSSQESPFVGVKSELGQGATFWFKVPLIEANPSSPPSRRTSSSSSSKPSSSPNTDLRRLIHERNLAEFTNSASAARSTLSSARMPSSPIGRSLLVRPKATRGVGAGVGALDVVRSPSVSSTSTSPSSRALAAISAASSSSVSSSSSSAPAPMSSGSSAKVDVPAPKASTESILFLDDSSIALKIADRMLNLLGHTAKTVQTGAGAITQARNNRYLIAFLDYNLGDGDPLKGSDVAKVIRGLQPHLRIVGLTAAADEVTRQAFLTAGANEVLLKPLIQADYQAAIGRSAPL